VIVRQDSFYLCALKALAFEKGRPFRFIVVTHLLVGTGDYVAASKHARLTERTPYLPIEWMAKLDITAEYKDLPRS
jgi:hypothetical protein